MAAVKSPSETSQKKQPVKNKTTKTTAKKTGRRTGEREILGYKGIDPQVREQVDIRLKDILTLYNLHYGKGGEKRIKEAVAFGVYAHEILCKQRRKSGLPYIYHPLEVARLTARNGLDVPAIVGAVLHDVIEDCSPMLEKKFGKSAEALIREWFGDRMLGIVNSLTKIKSNFEQDKTDKTQTFKRILESAAEDLRVLLIKIFDRITNIRELAPLKPEKQRRIALETLEVYVPIARWLFMHEVADELANTAIKFVFPDEFETFVQRITTAKRADTRKLNRMRDSVQAKMLEHNIEISSRVVWPHACDFYSPSEGFNPQAEFVHTIHVYTPHVLQVYTALGVIHTQYRVAHNRLNDSISDPFLTGYRALETTVIVGSNFVRFLLLTDELHTENLQGILFNWKHKANHLGPYYDRLRTGLKDLVEDPEEFSIDDLKDLGRETSMPTSHGVNVYTPNKDMYHLPENAIVVDFAYAIHRDLGNRCAGVEVNGSTQDPLYRLQEGDVVRIHKGDSIAPSPEWLDMAVTTRAKQGIRRALRKLRRLRAAEYGRQMVESYLRSQGETPDMFLSSQRFKEILAREKMDEDDFYLQVGLNKISLVPFLGRYLLVSFDPSGAKKTGVVNRILQLRQPKKSQEPRIFVDVTDPHDLFLGFAPCCNPIQGEETYGVLDGEEGQLVLHLKTCPHLRNHRIENLVGVQWRLPYRLPSIKIVVKTDDRPGILADVMAVTKHYRVNILKHAATTLGDEAFLHFELDVHNTDTLKRVGRNFRSVPGVTQVSWVQHDVEL